MQARGHAGRGVAAPQPRDAAGVAVSAVAAAEPVPPHETALWRAYLESFGAEPVEPRCAPVGVWASIAAAPLPPARRAAVLIEPRPHPLLSLVARNFASVLGPSGWGMVLVHGTANEDAAAHTQALLGGPRHCARIRLRGVADLSLPEYNRLLKTPPLWDALAALGLEHALIFQTDTLLLRGAGERMEAFMDYDYVGAPWCRGLWAGQDAFPVGNGGLSLRSLRAMRTITRDHAHRIAAMGGLNEDYVLARLCVELGFRVPHESVAAEFAVETVFHPAPLGLHKPHLARMPPGTLERWLTLGPAPESGSTD